MSVNKKNYAATFLKKVILFFIIYLFEVLVFQLCVKKFINNNLKKDLKAVSNFFLVCNKVKVSTTSWETNSTFDFGKPVKY